MTKRTKLFRQKRIYDTENSNELFFQAMKENCLYQYRHCPDYKRILDEQNFNPESLKSYDDLRKIPFIPTLYFKRHRIYSMSGKRMLIKATSSGTSGQQSYMGFNFMSLYRGLKMLLKTGKQHHLFSLKPAHYIVFGYEPSKKNDRVIAKSAYGFTFFSPALSKTFALRYTREGYRLDLERVRKKLIACSKSNYPVRTVGFPAYTYFLLKSMKDEGLKIKLPKDSILTLGGGWKQFYAQRIEKKEFYHLVEEVLGIDEKHIIEFFSAVEHPVLYTDCRFHHFHVPIYSRVIVRDPDTLQPVGNDRIGLINLLTPMVDSVPLLSVMTDDLGILHTEPCPCGISSPYLEIIGRVGVKEIVTCASGAQEFLKER